MTLFVYVDNSNLWIEGQYLHGGRDRIPANCSYATRKLAGPRWSYDFGRLHALACPPGEPIGRAVLFASQPPANDSLWRRAQSGGFDVQVFERNAANKEKQVDTGLATLMVADCYKYMSASGGDRVVLVAGDGDFLPPVREVQRRGIALRVVFWEHATSRALMREADEFVSLDQHYDFLTLPSRSQAELGRRPSAQRRPPPRSSIDEGRLVSP